MALSGPRGGASAYLSGQSTARTSDMNQTSQYTLNARDVEREELEVDVLLVGA